MMMCWWVHWKRKIIYLNCNIYFTKYWNLNIKQCVWNRILLIFRNSEVKLIWVMVGDMRGLPWQSDFNLHLNTKCYIMRDTFRMEKGDKPKIRYSELEIVQNTPQSVSCTHEPPCWCLSNQFSSYDSGRP